MLVVTVKDEQQVVLSRDGVPIGVLHVSRRKDGTIRLAIDLPRDIRIERVPMPQGRQEATNAR